MAALPHDSKVVARATDGVAAALLLGSTNCAITLLTLTKVTTAGVLFPGCILVGGPDSGLLIVSNVGPRLRGETYGVTNPKLA